MSLEPVPCRVAKDSDASGVDELRDVCQKLPRHHHSTLAYLMHHLKRVSVDAEANNMPSSNLGIVFGPTLLRTSEGSASLSSLVDTVHQTRVIELLIENATDIFGPQPQQQQQQQQLQSTSAADSTSLVTAAVSKDCGPASAPAAASSTPTATSFSSSSSSSSCSSSSSSTAPSRLNKTEDGSLLSRVRCFDSID